MATNRFNSWSPKENELLRRYYDVLSRGELLDYFPRRTLKAITTRAKVLGVTKNNRFDWTPERDDLIRKHYPTMFGKELAKRLGCKLSGLYARAHDLGVYRDEAQVLELCRTLGKKLVSHPKSIAHRFKKGQVSHNKGKKTKTVGRMAETQFKKGMRPRNYKPLGSFRYSQEGYLQKKVTETGYTPRDWRSVHVMLWEEHRGPVPPGHMIGFKDKDKSHITIDNLECVSLAENMKRNTIHNLPKPIKEVIQLNGALKRRLRRLEREQNNSRSS
jgi:hypothetical protein